MINKLSKIIEKERIEVCGWQKHIMISTWEQDEENEKASREKVNRRRLKNKTTK